ncbi:MAG TPA: alpha/beta hydrolase family protein [Anaerolineaceae bacterium]
MTSKILDYCAEPRLQPVHGLWKRYQPGNARYRFQAEDAAAACAWQAETRAALKARLGFFDLPEAPLNPQTIESVDKGDYTRLKLTIEIAGDWLMPFYLLLPRHTPPPYPVVVAFHGHGYGVKDIVGLWEDGSERDTPDGYHKDFGVALCRRGFAVAAPEISCFGERQTDFSYLNSPFGKSIPTTCTHTAMLAFHLGGSVVGLRAHEGFCLVDYLQTRPDLDTSRLGAMGISGGGMHTFFSTCLDERIRACVISGYYSTFQDSILAMHHCACNFVPGLAAFGEMYDLVGLIAPRPMLVESGWRDPIFPVQAVRASVARARQVYAVFGIEDLPVVDEFDGRHQISGRLAYDFLWKHLAEAA